MLVGVLRPLSSFFFGHPSIFVEFPFFLRFFLVGPTLPVSLPLSPLTSIFLSSASPFGSPFLAFVVVTTGTRVHEAKPLT